MKKLIIAVLCFSLTFLGGCWDMAEINERTFILAMGIDTADTDGQYKYTFHCASPSGESSDVSSNEMSYVNIVVTAGSLAPAISELIRSCDHNASFEHLQVLALGGEYVKTSSLSDLDDLFRIASVRRKCSVVVAEDEIGRLLTERGGDDSAAKIRQLVSQYSSGSQGAAGDFSLQELFSRHESDLSFYLPLVSIISSSDLGTAIPGSSSSENTESVFLINGICSFVDGKYRGSLGIPELETIRLLSNRNTEGTIASANTPQGELHYQIQTSKCRIDCRLQNNTPSFDIDLKIECMLLERSDGEENKALEFIERDIRRRAEHLIELSRGRFGAEIAGLETAARQSHPLWFERNRGWWESNYSDAEISVNVHCTAASDGFIN